MKDRVLFVLCLLMAMGIWLVHNLSQSYTSIVTVPVVAKSNIDGRAEFSAEEVSVVARCKASGFDLLLLKRVKDPQTVEFDPADFEPSGGDMYEMSQANLLKYSQAIFGENSEVEHFISQSVRFRFPEEYSKKVPVEAVANLSFRQQYMQTGVFVFNPDSVIVYGEPDRLAAVDKVITKPLNVNDIHGNLHGMISLEQKLGVRTSEKEVTYSLEVSRYVEIHSTANVFAYQVPKKTGLYFYPQKVDVKYRCIFPVIQDPVGLTTFYIDYDEFAESQTGKCLIRYDELPAGVIGVELDPEFCTCVEY